MEYLLLLGLLIVAAIYYRHRKVRKASGNGKAGGASGANKHK